MEDKTPRMPLPVLVEESGPHRLFCFRCDDRAGYLLQILWAMDGDLHISIVADPDHENVRSNCQRISGSVRIRVPLIGGGSFEHLFPKMVEGIRGEWNKYNKEMKRLKPK